MQTDGIQMKRRILNNNTEEWTARPRIICQKYVLLLKVST